MTAVYDRIGRRYAATRRTDPVIAARLQPYLAAADGILNIGAGTGSYEPHDANLVALEPSAAMIAQRPDGAAPVVQASAESLPFANGVFSHTLTVLSMHHWLDQPRACAEINRVTRERFVAVTWDPQAAPFWLTRDYFPEIHAADVGIFPALADLATHFNDVQIEPLPIPAGCEDGILAAFWRRPEAYLDPGVRASISAFAVANDTTSGVAKLERDLSSGAWHDANRDLLADDALDVGYRLVIAKIKGKT